MVLLSGKKKDNKVVRNLINCLGNKEILHQKLLYDNYKDPISKKIATIMESNMMSTPFEHLGHHFKNTLRILPEYELYHMWYGIPSKYDETILSIIKENIAKKIHYNKIKNIIILHGSQRV